MQHRHAEQHWSDHLDPLTGRTLIDVRSLSVPPMESGHRKAFAEAEQSATADGVTLTTFRIWETTDLSAVFSHLTSDVVNAAFLLRGIRTCSGTGIDTI